MSIVSFDKVGVEFGAYTLFHDISFVLEAKDRLGIVGVNGAGKSTLFRLLSGDLTPSSGAIYLSKNVSVGILTQNASFEASGSVFDEMLLAFSFALALERQINDLHDRLERRDLLTPEEHEALAAEYAIKCDRFAQIGGYAFRSRTRSMLLAAGFPEDMFSLPITALSGGQKTRLCLVRLLLQQPQLLMLDEPTNHLDFETLQWLETELRAYPGTVMVVSHDRYFLDRVVNRILEIENHTGTLYRGNYTDYIEKKKKDREIAEKHYKNQQKEIARIEAYITQQRRWNRERNIIAAESRQKMLDRMVKLERPADDPASVKIDFTVDSDTGNDVLTMEQLKKGYPGKPLFCDVSAVVKRHDRVFILGPNGCGKSTLLKILAGKLHQDSGEYFFGYRTKIGYYDQEQQQLCNENTVLDELWDCYEEKNEKEIRALLARFLFFADDMEKKVASLSGGERARLTLCKMILSHANVLILDEPTNHLDIPSREALEQALLSFPGTLLAVSHDRYFIAKLATRIFDLGGAAFADYPMGYEAYLAKRTQSRGDAAAKTEQKSEGKEAYERQKETVAKRRKGENARRRVDEACAKIEKRIAEIDKEANENAAFDYMRLCTLNAEKEALEEQLLQLYEESEDLAAQGF